MWGTIAVFLTVLAALAPHQAAAGAYCQPTLSAGVRCKNDGPWRATSVKTTLLPTSAVQVCYTLDSRRRASRACKRMSWDAVQVPMSIPCFNSSAINATLGGKPLAVSWDLPKTSGAFCEGNVAHATFSKRSNETYTAADKQLCYTLPPVVSRGSAVCSDVQPDGTRNLWFLSSKKSRCCPGTVLKDVIDRGADSCPADEGDLVFVSPGDKGGNITRFPGGSTGLVTQSNRVLKPVVTIPVNASDNGAFLVQVANFSYRTEPQQAFYKELVDVDPHGMAWYRFRQMWTDQCWQAVGDTPGNTLIMANCSDAEPLQRFYVAPTAYDTASLVNTLYTIQPRSGLCVTVEWPSNTTMPAPLTLQECKPTSPDTTQAFYIYATIRRTHCTPYPSTCADIGSYLLSLNPAPSGSSSDTKCLPLVRTPFASSTFVSGDCLYNSIDTIQVEYTNYGSSRCKVMSATYGGIPMDITQDQYTHGQSSVEVTYNGGDKLPTGPGLSLCLTFEPGCASQVQLSGTTVLDPKRHCCNRGGAWLNNYFPIPFPSSFPVGGYWEGYCQIKAARDNGQLTCSGQQEMLTQTAQLLVEQKGSGLQLTSTLQLLGDQDCQLPDNCQALCLSSANCELPKGCDSRLTGVQQGPVTVTYNSTNSTSGNAVIGYQNGNDIGIFSVTSGALVSFLMPPSVTVLVQAGIVNADPDTLSNFKTDAAGTLSGLLSGSAGLSCKSGGSGDVSYAYKCQYWQVADVDAVGLPFYQKLRGCPSTTSVPPTKPSGK